MEKNTQWISNRGARESGAPLLFPHTIRGEHAKIVVLLVVVPVVAVELALVPVQVQAIAIDMEGRSLRHTSSVSRPFEYSPGCIGLQDF